MAVCARCGSTQNRDTARFCQQCGASFGASGSLTCLRCGTPNPPGTRFCTACGSALVSAPIAAPLTGMLGANTLLQSRYVIVKKLGQGGMGAVYQAHDSRLQGKLWAVKEMSDAAIADPAERVNAIQAFQHEARLLALLDHPNLPKVVDFFDEAGRQYLVMDFIEGHTLEKIVASTPGMIPEPTVLGWMEQLCDVLDYLHARQPPIIFRDLKPANMMLTPDGKIKLIDFGIARIFKPGKTKDTAAYGTVGFAAPEQFGAGQTDARSDIYSFGVLLHHLLTKYDPALAPFNLPPARSLNLLVSPQTDAVIARATKMALTERFQSIRELRQSLFQTTPPPTPMPSSAPPPIYKPTSLPSTSALANLPGMIAIPAGEFIMGSNEDDDEKPPRRVRLDAFQIDRYPVTNAEYAEFIAATRHRAPDHWSGGKIPAGREDHPVVNVSWDDANAYAQWAGKRLPSEAEWEKAASWDEPAQTKRRYPWGDQFDARACNTSEANVRDTTPVNRYSPRGDSAYGVGDLVGNVKEWVADWYERGIYARSSASNPRGPAHGQFRVVRGGGFISDKDKARAAYRTSLPPSYKLKYVGFRCAS